MTNPERLAMTLFFFVVAVAPLAAQEGAAPRAGASDESPVGDWRGASICKVRESACHDEDSLYHVTPLAGKPGWFSMKADKIVDGKPVTMGTSERSYNANQRTLECALPRATLHFVVEGNKMQRTMTLPD
jgi:hypothetical protein